ncbi:MAG TPA: siderophore-interacting protein [Nocardioides sp.]
MAATNARAARTKPATPELLVLDVLESRRVSPHMVRVTLGGRDAATFVPLGFDQWFRLFIPVSENSLARVPAKLTTLSYVRFLTVSKTDRPVLRNYTVRAHRPDGPRGPEIDVDFVVHDATDGGDAGPATTWAQECRPGATVAILDEGHLYAAPADTDHHLVVVDESGLPAAAGILGSLPADARGTVLIEVPSAEDRQDLTGPEGVRVEYVVRTDPHAVPGRAVLAVASALEVDGAAPYVFVAGEQGLVTDLRRHLVQRGVPKERITFTGYWRAGKSR